MMLRRGAPCLLGLAVLLWSAVADAQTKMTIATGVDPVFSAYYVAQQEGLFKKHGLDVRINTGPSGSAMVAFLVNGQLESAFGSEIAYGLYRVTDAPADNWAGTGDSYVLADKLAADVFAAARVPSYAREKDVLPVMIVRCAHPFRGIAGGGGSWAGGKTGSPTANKPALGGRSRSLRRARKVPEGV